MQKQYKGHTYHFDGHSVSVGAADDKSIRINCSIPVDEFCERYSEVTGHPPLLDEALAFYRERVITLSNDNVKTNIMLTRQAAIALTALLSRVAVESNLLDIMEEKG